MAVNQVEGQSSVYNKYLQTQTEAVSTNGTLSMDDFWQLLAAELRYQDMTNPMSNSEMMSEMTQMSTMNTMSSVADAISKFATVTNNLSQTILTQYSTGMIGREVTVAVKDADGNVTSEAKGVVTGVDLTGAQYIYINGEKYELSQIMTVGEIPEEKKDEASGDGTQTEDGENKTDTTVEA